MIVYSLPLFCPLICFLKVLTPLHLLLTQASQLSKSHSWFHHIRETYQTLSVWCSASSLQSVSISSEPCVHAEVQESAGLFFMACGPKWKEITGEHIGWELYWMGFVWVQTCLMCCVNQSWESVNSNWVFKWVSWWEEVMWCCMEHHCRRQPQGNIMFYYFSFISSDFGVIFLYYNNIQQSFFFVVCFNKLFIDVKWILNPLLNPSLFCLIIILRWN